MKWWIFWWRVFYLQGVSRTSSVAADVCNYDDVTHGNLGSEDEGNRIRNEKTHYYLFIIIAQFTTTWSVRAIQGNTRTNENNGNLSCELYLTWRSASYVKPDTVRCRRHTHTLAAAGNREMEWVDVEDFAQVPQRCPPNENNQELNM